MKLKKFLLGFLPILVIPLVGCGVKGRPMVPDYPPLIGKGMQDDQRQQSSLPAPEPTKSPVITPMITPPPSVSPTKNGKTTKRQKAVQQ